VAGLLIGSGLVAGVAALFAGDLTPPGAPAPTMVQLDQLLPSWSRELAADDGATACESTRFRCVPFQGVGQGAVHDRATGLTWLAGLDGTVQGYASARTGCPLGTRLPLLHELESLFAETSAADGLPAGHPFTTAVLPVEFWSSTLDAVSPANAWALRVESDGAAGTTISRVSRTLASSAAATCVRGPASGVSWL
jgi:hypothetical protein